MVIGKNYILYYSLILNLQQIDYIIKYYYGIFST